MDRVRVVVAFAFGIVGLMVGVTLGPLLLALLRHSSPINSNPPDDSPVTVRGGSIAVVVRGGDWLSVKPPAGANKEYKKVTREGNASIYLYGVEPSGSPHWGSNVLPISNILRSEWSIKVWDRDSGGKPARNSSLLICSSPGVGAACGDTTQTIPWFARSYTTYFYTLNSLIDAPPDIPNEGDVYPYLLHDKNGDADGTGHIRDHIGLIDVTVGNNHGTYQCDSGMCTITIGGPAK
jgi:hypothetical protein